MEEETTKIVIDTLKYYKNKKTARELEEVPIDILRFMYLELLYKVEQLEKENKELKANNYEIKTTYRKMAEYFEKTGKLLTAEYMLAQIEDIPAWVVDDEKDYIPKSMIEEKINKLEESLWEKGYEDEKSYAIKVLKKLLEGEEKCLN